MVDLKDVMASANAQIGEKPPESRESAIFPSQNGSTTSCGEAPSLKNGC
jgi:hypothetical protein